MKTNGIKNRIRNFFTRFVETVKAAPAEVALVCFFTVYGVFLVFYTDELEASTVFEGGGFLLIYPLAFTVAYVLNRLLPSDRWRWVYNFSPLFVVPFMWVELENWILEGSYFTVLGLCVAAVMLYRWSRDNVQFAAAAIRYCKNALYAEGMASIAYWLIVAIRFSLEALFPSLPLGDEGNFMGWLAVVMFLGIGVVLFLIFDSGQRADYKPVPIVDILVNYVLTPAIMIYTVILYVYFIKIAVQWSLPDGGIAYMVFAFTIMVIFVKAYRPLMGKRLMEWVYRYFSCISLPALAMFWIATGWRVAEYGLTFARVYLVICGAIMTVTVLMFAVPRVAQYRYVTVLGAMLFSLVAFIPGITAEDIADRSQMKRFHAAARRLEMLDGEGKLIVRKMPPATESQAEDYATLYGSLRYVYRGDWPESAVFDGLREMSFYEFYDEVMPDNMSGGKLKVSDSKSDDYVVYLMGASEMDISRYASMHDISYSIDNDTVTISSSHTSELRRSYAEILQRQLAKTGLSSSATEQEIEKHSNEILFYEEDDFGIVFDYIQLTKVDSVLVVADITPELLLLKK